MSKLLLDANVSPALAEALRWRGHDAVHVNDVGLRHAPDPVIFNTARATRRAVITQDNDFLRLLAHDPGGAAVIHLSQRELQHNPVVGRLAQAMRLGEVLHELGDRLGPGLRVKVSSTTLRVDRAHPAVVRAHERGMARERGRDR